MRSDMKPPKVEDVDKVRLGGDERHPETIGTSTAVLMGTTGVRSHHHQVNEKGSHEGSLSLELMVMGPDPNAFCQASLDKRMRSSAHF